MKLKNQRGAAAVEFAIVLPVLVLLVFGIIEFSLALYDKAVITNASREGARAGIVARFDSVTGDYSPLTDAEITTVVNTYCSTNLITFGNPAQQAATTITRNGASPGGELRVRVQYPYTFLVLPRFITGLGAQINLGAETTMRLE